MDTRTKATVYYFLQGTFVPLTGADVSKVNFDPFMTKAFASNASMADFVNGMFLATIGIGAMLAVLQLARAGFLYMGSDVWHKKEQARHLMQDAVIGLLLLLSVWIVLNQINPQILNLDVIEKISPISDTLDAAAKRGDVIKGPVSETCDAEGNCVRREVFYPSRDLAQPQTPAQKTEQEQINQQWLDDQQYNSQ